MIISFSFILVLGFKGFLQTYGSQDIKSASGCVCHPPSLLRSASPQHRGRILYDNELKRQNNVTQCINKGWPIVYLLFSEQFNNPYACKE